MVHTNSDSAKREKVCHLALVSTYGTTTIWSYIKKSSTGMVDEKETVISSFSTLHIFVTEAGNALAALGNINDRGCTHKKLS